MKKQLIIAAIACAVSGAAFAATTGSHQINLTVDAPISTLEFTAPAGILGGATNWDFDTHKDLFKFDFYKVLGPFSLTGTGFTTETNCTLNITSDSSTWELRATNAAQGIKYGISSAESIAYGYAAHGFYSSTLRNTPFTTPIDATTHTCDATSDNLFLTTEPFPDEASRPEVGTYTDTIRFTVSAA